MESSWLPAVTYRAPYCERNSWVYSPVSIAATPTKECLAVQILHNQIVRPVVLADVMQRADVRMIEGRNRACLPLKPAAQIAILGDVSGKHFDGDGAIEARVAGSVDLTHAAHTDLGGH